MPSFLAYDGSTAARGADVERHVTRLASLPVVSLGELPDTGCELLAVLGGAHAGSSFKDLLGMGILILARESGQLAEHQAIIESTSGSMGAGLSWAGRYLGNPVTVVTDPNIPHITRAKITLLGAELVEVERPHSTGGWQQAREERVQELLQCHPEVYFVDQNNNPLNPAVHERWLIPVLQQQVDPAAVTAAVFVVGSGGHFSALSRWLKHGNPSCRTFAADRPGSITFAPADPTTYRIRGVGNSNVVPRVMGANMCLVDGVITVSEEDALLACREIARQHGLFVGGSSGVAYVAACEVARRVSGGPVLTMFPDRGELYTDLFGATIWNDEWVRRHAR